MLADRLNRQFAISNGKGDISIANLVFGNGLRTGSRYSDIRMWAVRRMLGVERDIPSDFAFVLQDVQAIDRCPSRDMVGIVHRARTVQIECDPEQLDFFAAERLKTRLKGTDVVQATFGSNSPSIPFGYAEPN